jgi:hypothetical protein
MPEETRFVSPEQVRAAVAAIEAGHAAGKLSRAEADKRIDASRRAVTPRDLHRASGGLAGDRRRQDWWDIRRTVAGLVFLLILMALLVWLVTWSIGLGDGTSPGGGGGY